MYLKVEVSLFKDEQPVVESICTFIGRVILLNLASESLILQVTILTFIHQDHMLQMLAQCSEVKKTHSCPTGKFVVGSVLLILKPHIIQFDCIS